MNNVTRDAAIRKIGKIRWTEEVKPVSRVMPFAGRERGFVIRTRPDTLSTFIEHTIRPRANEPEQFWLGGKAEKRTIKLPQYNIYVFKSYFFFQLANKPSPHTARFGITPQYHQKYSIENWNVVYKPCYGRDIVLSEYRSLKKWEERLLFAAEFLQGAIPHYDRPWWRTDFAYRLGLVGEEVIKRPTKKEQEREKKAQEEQVRMLTYYDGFTTRFLYYGTAAGMVDAALQQPVTNAAQIQQKATTNTVNIQQQTPPNITH